MIAAEALRTGLIVGPALAAFLGLSFLGTSSCEGDVDSAVTGRAVALGLLGPPQRPNERRDKAALVGLYPSEACFAAATLPEICDCSRGVTPRSAPAAR